jgi:hypothetical protein
MRDKDFKLLQEAYQLVFEQNINKEDYIGQYVICHPNKNEGARWSTWFWKKGSSHLPNGRRLFLADTIHLEDCEVFIPHYTTDDTLRNFEKPAKNVYTYATGKLLDFNFPIEKLNQIVSSGDFKSVSYNPGKHREYVYKDEKLPSYWHNTPELDNTGTSQDVKKRGEVMKSISQSPEYHDANIVNKNRKIEYFNKKEEKYLQGEQGYFYCDEIVAKLHSPQDIQKDYMWVKGVRH